MSIENILSTLERYATTAEVAGNADEAMELRTAANFVKRWIPTPVIRQKEPCQDVLCPACECSLSKHLSVADMVYWLDYCPNNMCHQRLSW